MIFSQSNGQNELSSASSLSSGASISSSTTSSSTSKSMADSASPPGVSSSLPSVALSNTSSISTDGDRVHEAPVVGLFGARTDFLDTITGATFSVADFAGTVFAFFCARGPNTFFLSSLTGSPLSSSGILRFCGPLLLGGSGLGMDAMVCVGFREARFFSLLIYCTGLFV
jgi:hypothetical protein